MKISIKLDRRQSGITEKGYPVVVSVSGRRRNKVARTGFYSTEQQWNRSLETPRRSHPEYFVLSDYLDVIKGNIGDVFRESASRSLSVDKALQRIFRKNYNSFYEAAMDYLKEAGPNDTRIAALRSFDSFFPDLPFSDIYPETVEAYIRRLEKKGNRPGGIDSYIRSLRALWNKLSDMSNPFSGHKIEIPERIKAVASQEDLRLLEAAELSYKGEIGSSGAYRDYWLLMFYLGGIDPEVLSKLRYDTHVVAGRIKFNRNKGRSKVACSNVIPDRAWRILERYECHPFLVPIYQSASYENFLKNFNRRFKKVCRDIGLSVELRPKGARYTFIDRAQQLLIDERITAQIVGHKRRTTTSLYTNDFPLKVQDRAHMRIISEVS